MGQAIACVAEEEADLEIVARCARGDSIVDAVRDCDVVIDVSHAAATAQISAACVNDQKPLVVGTTGHSASQTDAIHDAAKTIAILLAPNFSIGVNALIRLAREAAQLLGETFDIEIVESHHRMKKDAPSGTAKQLAETLCDVRGWDHEDAVVHGRLGNVGERPARQIGVHAVRGGDVIGEHTVIFAGNGERLELTHRASSRDTFATGALRAARWIAGRSAGLYTMQDVLGVRASR
jgi:4-hydroxy-tetrahydrodipicolinate reductase